MINCRPDGEDEAQPGDAEERRAAEAAGLAYHHIPLTGATITEVDVRAFGQAVAASNGKVLGHCKGGSRPAVLWALGEVLAGRLRTDDLDAEEKRLSVDLTSAKRWLANGGR